MPAAKFSSHRILIVYSECAKTFADEQLIVL